MLSDPTGGQRTRGVYQADPDPPARGPDDVEYFTEAQAGAWGEMLRAFARFAALPSGASVCDVGAGPGLLPRLLAEGGARLVVGCDNSWAMLARASALTGGGAETPAGQAPASPRWLAADVQHLPCPGGVLDGVVATNLLFLLPDPATGLAELCRVVRPDGIVALLNPTEAMSLAAAEVFMDARRSTGFARFSFINYARLAEAHHRLSLAHWADLAAAAGLAEIHTEARAGGLVGFVRGIRQPAEQTGRP